MIRLAIRYSPVRRVRNDLSFQSDSATCLVNEVCPFSLWGSANTFAWVRGSLLIHHIRQRNLVRVISEWWLLTLLSNRVAVRCHMTFWLIYSTIRWAYTDDQVDHDQAAAKEGVAELRGCSEGSDGCKGRSIVSHLASRQRHSWTVFHCQTATIRIS